MSLEASTATKETATEGVAGLAEKYLTFYLADEEYGIAITKVVEIIEMMEITSVPRTPDYVRGVINLRGKVIPVVELRKKFGMETIEDTDETCIIVVNVQAGAAETQMSILVDTVSEVLDIKGADIEPPPRFDGAVDTDFILGMAKIKGEVKILLEIDRVLSSEETTAMANWE